MRLQVDPGWNERRRSDLSCQSEQNGYLSPETWRIARDEVLILKAMHDGLHHLTTIAHRTGIPRTVVWRRMKSMLADGSVTVQRIGTADFYALKDI